MSPPGAVLADALLADRYRLIERIAVGGMGEVWRAEDAVLHRVVAVKTLKPEHLADDDFRARFRAEARHAGGLTHPGIASVYDYGESDGRAFLVMELVDGEPLSTLLRREGPLSVDRVLDLVAQVAAALHAAHVGGVVHRDVKPGNLLVRPDGVLKVTDFGIASAVDAVPLTQTGLVVGTAFYLSPEQALGRSATPCSDVYSLGVVAYECLVGQRPFPGDNPVAVAMAHLHTPPPDLPRSVPAPVRALVLRALAKEPAERFADAGELSRAAAALRARLAADPTVEHEEDDGLAGLPVEPPAAARAPEPPPTGVLAVPSERVGPRRAPRVTPGSRARSSRRAVRAVVLLLALLGLAVGVVRAGAGTPMVVVPTIAPGTPEAAATAQLLTVDLVVRRQAEPSTDVPAGQVLSQSPKGGTSLEPGSEVVLLVSEGPPPVTVDPADYVGKAADEVRLALDGLGLVPRLAYDGSGSPVGTVSDVQPTGELAPGSTVLLHVVPTPAPAPVTQAPAPAAPPAPETEAGSKGKGKGAGKGKGGK